MLLSFIEKCELQQCKQFCDSSPIPREVIILLCLYLSLQVFVLCKMKQTKSVFGNNLLCILNL